MKTVPLAFDCAVCGMPTTGKFGACQRTSACRAEVNRRWRVTHPPASRAKPPVFCEVCHQKMPRHGQYGDVCTKTKACRKVWGERYRAANRERVLRISSESSRRRRIANPELARSWGRKAALKVRRRAGGPCRLHTLGCTEEKLRNSFYCRTHKNEAERKNSKRRRTRMSHRLAEAQAWLCTWCGGVLPGDLADTHRDHIIPRILGGPDEDWNLEVLHAACNQRKSFTLTPKAIALAAEYGITLLEMPQRGCVQAA